MGRESYSIFTCKCGKVFKGLINIERHLVEGILNNEIGEHCVVHVKWINYRGEEKGEL